MTIVRLSFHQHLHYYNDQADTSSMSVPLYHEHLNKMIIFTPKSSATALVLVEMAMEDTMEKEPMGMRTKNNWRKTILELDDESGASQANAQVLYIGG